MISFRSKLALIIGKLCYRILRLSGHHGSTLPGLLIEKIAPNFLQQVSEQLNSKVIIVTGTNGKTTTTRILKSLLSSYGECISNDSGSNYTRGINSSLMKNTTLGGRIEADYVVLEVDEAYVPKLAKMIEPRVLLALNVLRDQLDRYGEIDTTAEQIKNAAVYSTTIIANALDYLLVDKTQDFLNNRQLFGARDLVAKQISNESNLHDKKENVDERDKNIDAIITTYKFDIDSNITNFSCVINGQNIEDINWSIHGAHNALNAVAALLTANQFVKLEPEKIKKIFKNMTPAYGRGEMIKLQDQEVVLNLVKNPSGFNQNLQTYMNGYKWDKVAVLINDNYADGRDVSWLWDVNIDSLMGTLLTHVGGTRKYDMALCLQHHHLKYDVLPSNRVKSQISTVLKDKTAKKIIIFATYTAMLATREFLVARQGGDNR